MKIKKTKLQGDKYDELRARYPKYVSKDQMYRICHIAKRTAKYLLDNGIIPCTDTGKRTRRYKVALEDIITYLKQREKLGSMVPCGAVNSRLAKQTLRKESFSDIVSEPDTGELRRYFEYIYEDFPDVVNTYDLSEMTGLCRSTLQRYLKSGVIQHIIVDGRQIIPKQYVLEFVTNIQYISIWSNSNDFKRILEGFMIWKNQR